MQLLYDVAYMWNFFLNEQTGFIFIFFFQALNTENELWLPEGRWEWDRQNS